MKKTLTLFLLLTLAFTAFGQDYVTNRGSGTIMISGSGTYQTDLSADFKVSEWNLGVDGALFFFPMLAAGLEFGYHKEFQELDNGTDSPTELELIGKYLGPRAYLFFGGKRSELTPFIKAGANYQLRNRLIDGDETLLNNTRELGLTASVGLLLNLAKNVGLSVESEYNFEKGTEVEDIDTKQLLVKFGIRSFLSD